MIAGGVEAWIARHTRREEGGRGHRSPLGAKLIRHIRPETFRRICMSFDAWVVAFGLAGLIRTLRLGGDGVAYLEFISVVAFDLWLLYRFFFVHRVHETGSYSGSTTTAMSRPNAE